jgi:hypothetical protein
MHLLKAKASKSHNLSLLSLFGSPISSMKKHSAIKLFKNKLSREML